jgi:peptidylprolyl isomerase
MMCCAVPLLVAGQPQATSKLTYSEWLASAKPSDWRALDAANTLVMELPNGRVLIELSAVHAPLTVANIRALVTERYFDGLSIVRSQDNYVVQWGDPDEKHPKSIKTAKARLAPEFTKRFATASQMPPFTKLPDTDGYAPEVGHSNGFPAARETKTNETWLAHCYGMVGVGRDNADDSGSGAELYAVTGHAPRHLDRNITLVGRVVHGMSLLSTLPRGTAALGFYEKAEQRVPILSVRLMADLPLADRMNIEVIRTDTPLWTALVESLRNRGGTWFKRPAGHIELCNVAIATRVAPPKAP